MISHRSTLFYSNQLAVVVGVYFEYSVFLYPGNLPGSPCFMLNTTLLLVDSTMLMIVVSYQLNTFKYKILHLTLFQTSLVLIESYL